MAFEKGIKEGELEEIRLQEAEELSMTLAKKYGVSYTDLAIVPVSVEAVQMLSEVDARAGKITVFQARGKKLDVGILTPNNAKARALLKKLEEKGFTVKIFLVSNRSLEKAWERYRELSLATKSTEGVMEISNERLIEFADKINTTEDIRALISSEMAEKNRAQKVSRIIEILAAGAIATNASDIHFEPEEVATRIRVRLDGVLHDVIDLPHDVYHLILSRIKILSGLKLNIKKEAQDGRMSIRIKDNDIEIRTSIIPGAFGESIVLRLLNPKTVSLDLTSLGIEPKLLGILKDQIRRPHGMILTTGPTGSGKTTTLYSFLTTVNDPEIKIITIEDPVEYHLDGITQTQTKKGYGFLEGLRSALRQDPDMIMVGEIRDGETAKVAVNAAQTGHLVFSTLHTNNAAGTIPRLLGLGVETKILGDALNISLAQRLVRKLCEVCKKKDTLTEAELEVVRPLVENVPSEFRERVSGIEKRSVWRSVGCDRCNKTGFKGRIGIFEGILTDDAVREAILKNPSEHDIEKAADSQGLLKMSEDGLIKVLDGVTTLEEVGKAVYLKEE